MEERRRSQFLKERRKVLNFLEQWINVKRQITKIRSRSFIFQKDLFSFEVKMKRKDVYTISNKI